MSTCLALVLGLVFLAMGAGSVITAQQLGSPFGIVLLIGGGIIGAIGALALLSTVGDLLNLILKVIEKRTPWLWKGMERLGRGIEDFFKWLASPFKTNTKGLYLEKSRLYTIKVSAKNSWEPTRATQFISRLLQLSPNVGLQIIATQTAITWNLLILEDVSEDVIKQTIRSFYPEAEIDLQAVELPDEEGQKHHKVIFHASMNTNIFFAPFLYAEDIKEVDPLAVVVQSMSYLQPQEQVTFTVFVRDYAPKETYEQAKKTIHTRNWVGAVLLSARYRAVFIPEAKERFVSDLQKELQAKLRHPLFLCHVSIQLDTPYQERIQGFGGTAMQLSQFDKVGFGEFYFHRETHTPALSKYLAWLTKLSRNDREQRRKLTLTLDAREIAALWHVPNKNFAAPTIAWAKKTVPVSFAIAQNQAGAQLGINKHQGNETPVFIQDQDRTTHMIVIGKSGMGKSTLAHNLIHHDIRAGKGVAVLDPHGDLVRDVLSYSIPTHRLDDVIVLDFADFTHPPALNLLAVSEGEDAAGRDNASERLVSLFERVYGSMQGTPKVRDTFRAALGTLNYATEATVMDVRSLFAKPSVRRELLEKARADKNYFILDFWREYLEQTHREQQMMADPVTRRMRSLFGNRYLLPVLCHPSLLNFGSFIREKKIVLISLGVDERLVPKAERDFLGSLMVSMFEMAAMSFTRPHPFNLYIDEAQNFVSSALPKMFAEVRKRGMALTLFNQFLGQLAGDTLDSVMNNTGAIIGFQMGLDDARLLSKYMPVFEPEDLLTLNRHEAAVWMRSNGEVQPAFTLTTLPPQKKGEMS
jgi:hypothetical protein